MLRNRGFPRSSHLRLGWSRGSLSSESRKATQFGERDNRRRACFLRGLSFSGLNGQFEDKKIHPFCSAKVRRWPALPSVTLLTDLQLINPSNRIKHRLVVWMVVYQSRRNDQRHSVRLGREGLLRPLPILPIAAEPLYHRRFRISQRFRVASSGRRRRGSEPKCSCTIYQRTRRNMEEGCGTLVEAAQKDRSGLSIEFGVSIFGSRRDSWTARRSGQRTFIRQRCRVSPEK